MKKILLLPLFAMAWSALAAEPRLVAIGNSLTRHSPAKDLDWDGDWGMAASSKENDYVGVLAQRLGVSAPLRINAATLERAPTHFSWNSLPSPQGHFVIVELGDNVTEDSAISFANAYENLLSRVADRSTILLCTSTWWNRAPIDIMMRAACTKHGGIFVDISGISSQPGMRATSAANAGVAAHPSDKGMDAIAGQLMNHICRQKPEFCLQREQ